MRFCKWCQRQGIASAVFFSVTVAAAVYAEGPQGGGLTDSVVTDLHSQSPNSPASIQQVSDEEAVPAPQKLIDPVVVASQAMESPESSSPIPDVPLPEASYQYSGSATAPQAAPCSCCNSTCRTKKKKEAATAAMKAAFGIVFYDNNFSYLNDKCYDGPSFCGDNLKGLCNGKLDIGGEARVRFHSEDNIRGRAPIGGVPSGLGLTGNDDDFWLTRYRMYADYRMNDIFRFYGEYLYADSGGEILPSRPIEENRGDIQNLFVDAKLTDKTTLRVGRQELLYGNQRLISPLDWANTRRTFEGGRFLYKGKDWNLDGFYVNPLNRDFDDIDEANYNVDFYGLWGTRKGLEIGNLDAYYLGLNNKTANFNYQTLGSRVSGSTDKFLYELEGGVQFGSNSPGYGDHGAGFFTGGLGKKLSICTRCGEWNPTVWFWYDWASGGDQIPAARGDDGFDDLFPLSHKYLGFMDLFGRRNINDANVQFITPVMGDKVKLLVWYHHFFLDQATTPYDVAMFPFNPNNAAGDKELGDEIDILFSIALNPRNSALVGYSYFNAGEYYDTTPGTPTNADADFFYFQYQTRF